MLGEAQCCSGSEVGEHRKLIWVSYAPWAAGVCTFSVQCCVPLDSFMATVTSKQRNTKLNIYLISLRQMTAMKSNWWATHLVVLWGCLKGCWHSFCEHLRQMEILQLFDVVIIILLYELFTWDVTTLGFQINDLHDVLERLQNNQLPALKKKHGYLPVVCNATAPSTSILKSLFSVIFLRATCPLLLQRHLLIFYGQQINDRYLFGLVSHCFSVIQETSVH